MPPPMTSANSLLSFRVLSFDVYGTLVDWETSILSHLESLLVRLPPTSAYTKLKSDKSGAVRFFDKQEHAIQSEHPQLKYDLVLRKCYLRAAKELGVFHQNFLGDLEKEAETFGNSVGQWTAFPDTVSSCQRLAKYFKLVVLSNVDRASFTKTCEGPLKGVPFWHSYVAEEIGSYKPDLRNFEYLIQRVHEDSEKDFGKDQIIGKAEILHTAQSLFHDHVPAKKMDMSSCWIARKGAGSGQVGDGALGEGRVGYGWRFSTMGDMADAVEKEARDGGVQPRW